LFSDVYHASQNDLILDTKVRGNPRPEISWTKDQIPVVIDDRVVQIEHLDGICELIINKPTINDNGIYVCTAKSKLGTQSTTHTVVVDTTHTSRRSSILSAIAMQEGGESAEGGKAKGKKKKKEAPTPVSTSAWPKTISVRSRPPATSRCTRHRRMVTSRNPFSPFPCEVFQSPVLCVVCSVANCCRLHDPMSMCVRRVSMFFCD